MFVLNSLWRLCLLVIVPTGLFIATASIVGTLFAATLAIIVAGAIAIWLSRRSSAAIGKLQSAVDRLGTGDFDARVYAPDEFAPLSRSFNEMAAHLAERFGQTSAEGQRLRMTLA